MRPWDQNLLSFLLSSQTFLAMTSTPSSSSFLPWPTMELAWRSAFPPATTVPTSPPASLAPSTGDFFQQGSLMFSTQPFPCIGYLRYQNL
ncbi:hypothetical protein VIGAN_05212600 [Vigna angularis var. angularis]|uniref:Secreted protein n=1 Tax=Vigna angularis var. angularis TaxID=157739 RepID=A0A0S3S702_PHAAN|nr:hypothetical protein VIGAN_05212600 [Vigna angularis var. angularis]